MKTYTKFKLSTVAAALMVVYGVPAVAEDVAEYIKPDSSVSLGVGTQNHNRPRLGLYDGRQEDGASIMLDADIKLRDDATGTWNELKIYNFGLDNGEIFLGHSVQGDYGASLEYSRIPRENQYTVNTGLRGIGTVNETVTALTAPGRGANVHLGTQRDRYTLSFKKSFSDDVFELTVKYRNEEKDGTRNFGFYDGSNARFLIEPINSTTRQLDVALNYLGKDLKLQGGYYGSWYDDNKRFITAVSGVTTNYIALPPDNEAQQFYVNGAYTFSPSTTGTFRVATSKATQEDRGLAGTVIPVMAGFSGIKAKVVTNEVQLGVSSAPMKDLSLLANVNYHDRDDKTPHVAFNSQPTPDETTPHSFRTLNWKFEAAYRVTSDTRLLGAVYLEDKKRTIPFKGLNNAPAAAPTYNVGTGLWTVPVVGTNEKEVPYREKNKEVTYKVQVSQRFTEEFNGSLAVSHSKRDGSSFHWTDQLNLISPLHMADRERDKVGLNLDWSPSERLSLQAQLAQTKDDYDPNGLRANATSNGAILLGTGVKDGRANLFTLDGAFTLNDDWKLTAWYSMDETKVKQYMYQATTAVTFARADPIRKANLKDMGESFGFGMKGKAMANLDIGADVQWTRSEAQ